MGKKVPLGRAAESGVSIAIEPKTVEERVAVLEEEIKLISKALQIVKDHTDEKERFSEINEDLGDVNKDGIPLDTNLVGMTKGMPYVLTVKEDGYYVGIHPYPSLSAAAQGVSGSRRSGWAFWKVGDGRTAKQAFGKR